MHYPGYDPARHKSLKEFQDECKRHNVHPYCKASNDPLDRLCDTSALTGRLEEGDPYIAVEPDGTVYRLTIPPLPEED